MGYNYSEPPILSSSEFEELGSVFVKDDLRDLAFELDMDVMTMTTTVATYNEGIQNNEDLLGKDVPHLTAIQTAPFYAVQLQLSTGKSFGGAEVNTFGQTEMKIFIPLVNQRVF